MITYLILTGIVLLILFILHIFPLERKMEKYPLVYIKKRPNYLDELSNNLALINFGGYVLEEIHGGKGEFGYTVTNPIPIKPGIGYLTYFKQLRTFDDKEIRYKYLRTTEAYNIGDDIDEYEIIIDNEKVTNLFVCPFYLTNSTRAPYGLKIIKDEIK